MKSKNILSFIFIVFFIKIFSCADEYKNSSWPHEEFKKTDGTCYRIEADLPSLGLYKTEKDEIKIFPFNDMGIIVSRTSTGKYREWDEAQNYAVITIIPTIVFMNSNTSGLLRKRGGDIFWEDFETYAYNCEACSMAIYDNGISMIVDDPSADSRSAKVVLKLEDDGKYYEVKDESCLGKIKATYDKFDYIPHEELRTYAEHLKYEGFVFFSINKKKKEVEQIILQGIKFYNKTKSGIEFITPYGAGFYSFETMEINLVPKETYIGRNFVSYKSKVSDFWFHGTTERKVITMEDFALN